MIGKRVEAGCCRRPTGAGYAVLSMPPNFGRLMLAEIGPVWTVLIGSSKDGARTFIMPCTVGVHAEKFTILGGCSLQWQGHHSPTSNYIEGPVATDNRMVAERAMSRPITRKPSCLISCSQSAPEGGRGADVGGHGAMKPGGMGRRHRRIAHRGDHPITGGEQLGACRHVYS